MASPHASDTPTTNASPAEGLPTLGDSLLRVWDEVPEAVAAVDSTWRYRYLNNAAYAMLGLTPDVLGRDYREVHPELPGTAFGVVHERVMQSRVIESLESYYEPLDTYLRVRVMPWPGSGIVLSFRDVTEERRPEARLRRNLDLYRQVVDHMTQAITLRDLDGRFLLVNEAAATRLGRPVEAILGATVSEVLPPDIARLTLEVDARVLATGVPQDNPGVHHLHPDRKVLARVFPVYGDDAAMMGIVTTVLDVTELSLAQAELTASQLRFRRVFASTSLGVLVMQENGEILEANSAFCRLVGLSRQALMGKRGADLLRSEAAGERRRWLGEEGEEGYEVEDELVRADGSLVPVLLTVNSFDDVGGRGRLASCVVRDLTDVHRLQAQLVAAERMEALGWLAAGVAHDANNILTAVSGYAELLEPHVLGHPDAERHLQGIARSVGRAGDMVARLLAVVGGESTEPALLDLAELAQDMEDMLRRLLPPGVRLELELHPAPARGDASQLRQVVLNLVVNARHALDGTGAIVISTGPGPEETVHLSVADDGPGMAADVAQRCFEPFFTTRHGSGGTGVGLSTARDIALEHGGDLTVSTALHQGTVFELALPAATQPPPAEPTAPVLGTVVVADDDPVLRDLMMMTLELAGYRVVGAQDGAAALALADRASLVVSDVDMPVMTGIELAECLRRRRPPAVPLLLVSGQGHPLPEGLPFLAKPFTGPDLLDAVEAALRSAP